MTLLGIKKNTIMKHIHLPRIWLYIDKRTRLFIRTKEFSGLWRYTIYSVLTSKPCNRPTSIMSLAALGTTCMTCIACRRASISSANLARSVYLNMSRKSSWYFIILWTGFMRMSLSWSLWPRN